MIHICKNLQYMEQQIRIISFVSNTIFWSIEISCADRTIELSIKSFGPVDNKDAEGSSHNTEC
jgi:hypothetical protein